MLRRGVGMMNAYEEYTLYLIAVPAVIMARLGIHFSGVERDSIKGFLLYFAFLVFFSLIFAMFVFLIRYIRA